MAIAVQADVVAQPDDVSTLLATTRDTFGPVDILVTNAGREADGGSVIKITSVVVSFAQPDTTKTSAHASRAMRTTVAQRRFAEMAPQVATPHTAQRAMSLWQAILHDRKQSLLFLGDVALGRRVGGSSGSREWKPAAVTMTARRAGGIPVRL
ncbi:hypothetical protein [Streptomyces sp. enrichment culture]|uniref:hypothetical protein n=1 Tax=Streptomyces sp. enrichment culture TaxID=1795815 RepID=UPI003F5621E8